MIKRWIIPICGIAILLGGGGYAANQWYSRNFPTDQSSDAAIDSEFYQNGDSESRRFLDKLRTAFPQDYEVLMNQMRNARRQGYSSEHATVEVQNFLSTFGQTHRRYIAYASDAPLAAFWRARGDALEAVASDEEVCAELFRTGGIANSRSRVSPEAFEQVISANFALFDVFADGQRQSQTVQPRAALPPERWEAQIGRMKALAPPSVVEKWANEGTDAVPTAHDRCAVGVALFQAAQGLSDSETASLAADWFKPAPLISE